MRAWKHACLWFTLCVTITLFSLFLQNFTFNDDFSPSSTSSADLSGLGAEPKTPGLSQSLALSSDEVLDRHHGRAEFSCYISSVSHCREIFDGRFSIEINDQH